MRSARGLILTLLGATAASAAEQPARPVDIHFTSRTTIVNGAEMKAAAKARQAEAARKAKELEQAYTAQYGKDHRKWPFAKRAEVSALGAEARPDEGAAIEAEYAAASPKELADSARDLAKAAGPYGKRLLRAVESADQADLVVEVTGRHSSKSESGQAFADQFGFMLRVSAGGKLAAGRLHGAVARWPAEEERDDVVVNELHGYSDDEPYWRLQIMGGQRWVNLATLTDEVLADFVRTNGSLFAGK
jgi:hypothetical protein